MSQGWGPPGLTLAICMNSAGYPPPLGLSFLIWKMGIMAVTPREAIGQIKQGDKVTHLVGAEKTVTLISCLTPPLAHGLALGLCYLHLASARPGAQSLELTCPHGPAQPL